MVFTPAQSKTLLTIPGLGELQAICGNGFASIDWLNTTSGPVDAWFDDNTEGIVQPVGTGNDPGPRRVASLKAASFVSGPSAPCGFQAQGTLWTSP